MNKIRFSESEATLDEKGALLIKDNHGDSVALDPDDTRKLRQWLNQAWIDGKKS